MCSLQKCAVTVATIDFGIPGETGQLQYVGIRTLANKFRKMSGYPYDAYFRLYIAGDGNRQQKLQQWKADLRYRYFFAFWDTIRQKYDGELGPGDEVLWRPGVSQLLRMKTLDVLQGAFFEWMQISQRSFPGDIGSFRETVRSWLKFVPRAFFAEKWRGIRFGSKEARELINGAFVRLQKDPTFRFTTSRLFQE